MNCPSSVVININALIFINLTMAVTITILYQTISYVFDFGPSDRYLQQSQEHLHVDRLRGPTCIGLSDFSMNSFLELQNKQYNLILNLIDNIAHGLHIWHHI